MKAHLILASVATLALAACGGGEDDTQINSTLDTNMAMATGDNMAGANVDDMNMSAATATSGQDYATKAAAGDMFEIESAQLALEKTQDDDIREIAQMIITDHQKSTADLKTAASQAQPAITVTPALTPEQQANMEALRAAAAGAEFDRLWVSQQIPAHEKTLALVQDYAANGDVASLKQHASTVAGPVERHLNELRDEQQ